MQELSNINRYLKSKEKEKVQESPIIYGPDTVKNILVNETLKINRLEKVTNTLLDYITDEKTLKRLSYKEKQELLKTINEIQTNSRDFIFKTAELASKNTFLQKVLEASQQDTPTVITETGEVFKSGISEETRRNLSELLRDMVNDQLT